MRIVGWTEFQTLPPGTVYQEYTSHFLGDLMILGEVLEISGRKNDFVAAQLTPATGFASYWGGNPPPGIGMDDLVIYSPDEFGRCGMFEYEGKHWLIWEEDTASGWPPNSSIQWRTPKSSANGQKPSSACRQCCRSRSIPERDV